MNSARLLLDLHQRGVEIRVDGDRVRWRAPSGALVPDDLDLVRAHRDEVLDLLDAFEERAAILEFEHGMTRADAECAAWAETYQPKGTDQ